MAGSELGNPASRKDVLKSMKRLLLILAALPFAAARQATVPTAFKTCTVNGLRLMTQAGQVRFAEYGHRYPDNVLRVSQSYDRAGHLSGVSVNWSGFAGQILEARAAYDTRGRLIKESGYRRAGFVTPLKSYVKPLPKGAKC